MRGFGPLGILAILVILGGALAGPVVSAVLVLLWAHLSHTPLRALGFVRPRSWTLTLGGGAALGIVFKLAMKAIVMPLLGAPGRNMTYSYIAGNPAALPAIVTTVLLSAGFG